MNKPMVGYKNVEHLELGQSALVFPVDHPSPLVSNKKWILTSPVIKIEDDGQVFETLNTIYAPYEEC